MFPLAEAVVRPVSRHRFWAGAAGLIATLLGLQHFLRDTTLGDPDRFYHLALARWTAQHGFVPSSLPQVDWLGWGNFFPDKEFLFHLITSAAYRLAGESGVLAVPAIVLALTIVGIYRITMRLWRRLSPVPLTGRAYALAATALAIPQLVCPMWVWRMSLLRPHGLAICLFVWLVGETLENRRWLVGILCGLFALAYHAAYIPISFLTIDAAVRIYPRRSTGWRSWRAATALLGVGVAGILLGSVLNPYFPSNIMMGWQHLRIALTQAQFGELNFGSELIPLRSDELIKIHAIFLAIVFGTAFWWGTRREESPTTPAETGPSTLLSAAFFFWLLSALSPRSREYAIPLTSLLLPCLLAPVHGRRRAIVFTVLVAIALLATPSGLRVYASLLTNDRGQSGRQVIADLQLSVPPSPEQPTTEMPLAFNCEWDISPYIFYARPSWKFLDILDPSFLFTVDRDASDLRERFNGGGEADPFDLLVRRFHADYVVCRNTVVRQELDRDPHFTWLNRTPIGQYPAVGVYRVRQTRAPQMVLSFQHAALAVGNGRSYLKMTPADVRAWKDAPSPAVGGARAYLAFENPLAGTTPGAHDPEDRLTGKAICQAVRPARSEVVKHAGARWLAVGGGRNIRAWLNGKPWYTSVAPAGAPHLINTFVRFPSPLTVSDRIEVVTCSAATASFLGIAMSFWKDGEIESTCRSMNQPTPLQDPFEKRWLKRGIARLNCMGPEAIPAGE